MGGEDRKALEMGVRCRSGSGEVVKEKKKDKRLCIDDDTIYVVIV